LVEVFGSKNFCQFVVISRRAAAASAGPPVDGAADGVLRSTEGVGGGLSLPPPLSSLHAVRATARTNPATSPRLPFLHVRSLPRTIWLTTGCRSGPRAPSAFRVSFKKA
jgi:hypothetical protein